MAVTGKKGGRGGSVCNGGIFLSPAFAFESLFSGSSVGDSPLLPHRLCLNPLNRPALRSPMHAWYPALALRGGGGQSWMSGPASMQAAEIVSLRSTVTAQAEHFNAHLEGESTLSQK